MINIDRYFFGLAVLAALTGMTLGIVMAAQQNFQLAPVHAHINLVGWASLALFGLGYRTGLARNDGLAKLHFVVALAGVVVFPVGIYYAVARQIEIGAMVGSLLVIASMLIFGINFLRGK
ncbi:MAG TPA: hypothetical protein VL966_14930 [Alphaproteobacteria bacterium]|jgi:hypothetical protein|nr:hypothetical protein [Alphaproteobacteria bacterium]